MYHSSVKLTCYLRAILHDDRMYPEPYKFQPERFISNDGSLRKDIVDPRNFVFGFGRRCVTICIVKSVFPHVTLRICPGRYHAYNNALILAASLIATFEMKPDEAHPLPELHRDARDREDVSRVLMESGFITYAFFFQASFQSYGFCLVVTLAHLNASSCQDPRSSRDSCWKGRHENSGLSNVSLKLFTVTLVQN